jgi:hypothetical protein
MKFPIVAALAAAAFLALSLAPAGGLMSQAQAQTPPAAKPAPKPPAKPAAKPAPAGAAAADSGAGAKTLSMGGVARPAEGAASGVRRGIMTRDELRACLTDEANIRGQLEALDKVRAPLEPEKAQLTADQQTLREERNGMEATQKDIADSLNAKFKAFAAKVEASNARVAAFNDAGKTGSAAERERQALNKERAALETERVALEAEKDDMVAKLKVRVDSFNERAQAVERRVVDWNARNAKVNDDAQAVEAERKDWVANCSNRRYREDDEIAIKAGK